MGGCVGHVDIWRTHLYREKEVTTSKQLDTFVTAICNVSAQELVRKFPKAWEFPGTTSTTPGRLESLRLLHISGLGWFPPKTWINAGVSGASWAHALGGMSVCLFDWCFLFKSNVGDHIPDADYSRIEREYCSVVAASGGSYIVVI